MTIFLVKNYPSKFKMMEILDIIITFLNLGLGGVAIYGIVY